MKSIATVLLAVSSLVLLTTVSSAQNGPAPNITSAPQRKAYAPGNVVVNGTNLGLISNAKVNGVSYPIIRATAGRLVIGPVAPQPPGFGVVQVLSGRGTDSEPISFLPTLIASRTNRRLTVTLNNGDVGTYIVRLSYSAVSPTADLGIYGSRVLPLNAKVMTAGAFPDANPITIGNLLVPLNIGQVGAPFQVQAQCFAATANVTSYTNVVVLPGYGQHQ